MCIIFEGVVQIKSCEIGLGDRMRRRNSKYLVKIGINSIVMISQFTVEDNQSTVDIEREILSIINDFKITVLDVLKSC